MPAMSGDVCALKGRLLQMSAADVRGAGLSFKRAVPPGLLQPMLGGYFPMAIEGGALLCLCSFVDTKCIQKNGFGLIILKKLSKIF